MKFGASIAVEQESAQQVGTSGSNADSCAKATSRVASVSGRRESKLRWLHSGRHCEGLMITSLAFVTSPLRQDATPWELNDTRAVSSLPAQYPRLSRHTVGVHHRFCLQNRHVYSLII